MYLIYDARYNIDEDSATILATADTMKEAKEISKEYGDDCVIVEI
jgi:hypothetical protein